MNTSPWLFSSERNTMFAWLRQFALKKQYELQEKRAWQAQRLAQVPPSDDEYNRDLRRAIKEDLNRIDRQLERARRIAA